MHNNDSSGDNRMKWGMILCYGLLPIVVLFWLFGGKSIGAFSWIIWGGSALMMGIHIVMMARSHKHDSSESDREKSEGDIKAEVVNKKTHSGGGCCH